MKLYAWLLIFIAVRDLFCTQGSIDMGFEEITNRVWWMEEMLILPWYNRGVSDIEECRSLCLNYSCISFTQTLSKNICSLHDGHWYDPQHYRWVVTGLKADTYNGHRLCFKGRQLVFHWLLLYMSVTGRTLLCCPKRPFAHHFLSKRISYWLFSASVI